MSNQNKRNYTNNTNTNNDSSPIYHTVKCLTVESSIKVVKLGKVGDLEKNLIYI